MTHNTREAGTPQNSHTANYYVPTHNTREVEDFDARTFVKKARKQNWKNGGVLAYDDDELIEELETTLHHQLQKAREELMEKFMALDGTVYGGEVVVRAKDVKKIISELDQDVSK